MLNIEEEISIYVSRKEHEYLIHAKLCLILGFGK